MRTYAWEPDKIKEIDYPISMIIIMSRTKTDNDTIETEQDCVKTSGAAMLTLFSHMNEMTDRQCMPFRLQMISYANWFVNIPPHAQDMRSP